MVFMIMQIKFQGFDSLKDFFIFLYDYHLVGQAIGGLLLIIVIVGSRFNIKNIHPSRDKNLFFRYTKNVANILLLIGYILGSTLLIISTIISFMESFGFNKYRIPDKIIELSNNFETKRKEYLINPEKHLTSLDSIWNVAKEIAIEDKKGKKVLLNIYTLSHEYTWEKGKYDKIKNIKTLFGDKSFEREILSNYFFDGYKNYTEIICVGNASFEEDKKHKSNFTKIEEERAFKRAEFLSASIKSRLDFIADSLNKNRNFNTIKIVNLGVCRKVDTANSDYQRRVIIIGVTKLDEGVDLKEAIHLHLMLDNNIPFRFWDYSLGSSYEKFFNGYYK